MFGRIKSRKDVEVDWQRTSDKLAVPLKMLQFEKCFLFNVSILIFSVFFPSNFKTFYKISHARSLLQSGSARDNFNQLSGDDSLTCSVESQCELVNHLASVLWSVVHGSHSGRLFRASAFLHCVEQHRSQRELQVALDDLSVQRIVNSELWCSLDRLQAVKWQVSDGVRHNRLESVVNNLSVSELVAQVHDFVGQLGGVQERWRQTADLKRLCNEIEETLKNSRTYFVADHEDLFAVQALQDGTRLVTDADDLNAGIGRQLTTNVTNDTGVNSSAQSWNYLLSATNSLQICTNPPLSELMAM